MIVLIRKLKHKTFVKAFCFLLKFCEQIWLLANLSKSSLFRKSFMAFFIVWTRIVLLESFKVLYRCKFSIEHFFFRTDFVSYETLPELTYDVQFRTHFTKCYLLFRIAEHHIELLVVRIFALLFALQKSKLGGQIMNWIGAQFCVCMFLD